MWRPQGLGAIPCRSCGVKVREDRVRCPRCGSNLRREQTTAFSSSRTRAWLVGLAAVACLGLGGFAAVQSQPGAADVPGGTVVADPGPRAAAADVAATVIPGTKSYDPEREARRHAAAAAKRIAAAAYTRGDLAVAREHFEAAVVADPEDAEALNNLGQALVRLDRAHEAIRHFDAAIALRADVWAYHFNRARAYTALEQWGRAIAGYRDAARLFPEDYVTQFNLAKALQASGDLTGAIEAFERAIALAPGQADFHLSHGLALDAAGRARDAAAAYQRFLELEPDSPDAGKIKAAIERLESSAS